MAFPTYYQLAFPHSVGGPGPWDTIALAITAITTATTTPVLAQTDLVAFYAASANDQARHQRFSDVVSWFSRYGMPISAESDGDSTITLKFDRKGMFENSTKGKPDWFSYGHRPNGYDLAASFVASNSVTVSAIAVTVNGVSQSGT